MAGPHDSRSDSDAPVPPVIVRPSAAEEWADAMRSGRVGRKLVQVARVAAAVHVGMATNDPVPDSAQLGSLARRAVS